LRRPGTNGDSKGSSESMSTPNPSGFSSPPNKTRERYDRAVANIAKLVEMYPACFFVWERRRSPLKIGIHHEIVGFDPTELSTALAVYCRAEGYLYAISKSLPRIGLFGEPAGETSDDDRQHALHQLKIRFKKREAKKKAAATSEKPAAPVIADVKPKRLGLSDLRLAAQARRGAVA